jgi:hypothetical protein
MSQSQRPYCPPGTLVNVFGLRFESLGTGTLLTAYDFTDSDVNEMPQIRMPDGRIIQGYQCWWIPVDEAGSCLLPPKRQDVNIREKGD